MDKTDNMDKIKQRMLDAAEAMYEFDPCERSEIWCERMDKTEEWVNNYLRGILGYSTSNKMFAIELQKLGIDA